YCYVITGGYGGETQEELMAEFREQNPEAFAANDARLAAEAAASGSSTAAATVSSSTENTCEHEYVAEITKEPTETEYYDLNLIR
ncbi:MAG TPA: hypothetical protein PLQ04_09355, partial [Lachnospiraceae bacterium]|nr:hypothetical protein [Lachnospiraceae bacterium]